VDLEFDLRGGVDLVRREGEDRKSLKVLTVEIKVILLACFCHITIVMRL